VGDVTIELAGQRCLAPAWARWFAQDADGTWWAYEVEPHQHDSGWYENEVGNCQRLFRAELNAKWRSALKGLDAVRIPRASC
jgi:hypothetical protein